MELTPLIALILIIIGSIAGVINVLAGGGSNLTLPSLMIMGMAPEVANASNRLGIFIQSLVGVRSFKKHGKLEVFDLWAILIPTLIGGAIGALLAAYAPSTYLKPLLLGTMLAMALLMLLKPSLMAADEKADIRLVAQTPSAWWSLLIAGIYGGFVQAGVGFVLLAALTGTLGYDLVRANALKLVCALGFTLVALVIFIYHGQVDWKPALVLTIGYVIGAQLGVKFAIKIKPQTLKWFLFIMTLVAVVAASIF